MTLPSTAATSAAAMFVRDRMMASTSLAGAAAVFPVYTAKCTSVTDRRTLTSLHKREIYITYVIYIIYEMYISHLALKSKSRPRSLRCAHDTHGCPRISLFTLRTQWQHYRYRNMIMLLLSRVHLHTQVTQLVIGLRLRLPQNLRTQRGCGLTSNEVDARY